MRDQEPARQEANPLFQGVQSALSRLLGAYSFIGAIGLLILTATVSEAHFFSHNGYFLYALNSDRSVFDITEDGRMAVALKNDPMNTHPALLTSFDPTSGAVFDNKTFGFGPLEVELAETPFGLRVVVLTSEGGPRKIYLFSLDETGALTQLGSTQLTTSGTDFGSNLIVDRTSQAGFVIVAKGLPSSGELVTFSLFDASILKRLEVAASLSEFLGDPIMTMVEKPNQRILTFSKYSMMPSLATIDVTDPVQPMDLGAIRLSTSQTYRGGGNSVAAVSSDGRYVFLSEPYAEVVIVDLEMRQTVSAVPGAYQCSRVRLHENVQQRLVAAQCFTTSGTGNDHGVLLLIDATNLQQPQVIKELNLGKLELFYRDDIMFSKSGTHLFIHTGFRLMSAIIPSLTTAWEEPVPGASEGAYVPSHHLMIYGQRQLFAAWGSSNALFGSFDSDKKRRSQLTSQ